jgi:hypothetical protein
MGYGWFNRFRSIAEWIGLRSASQPVESSTPASESIPVEVPAAILIEPEDHAAAIVEPEAAAAQQQSPAVAGLVREAPDHDSRRKLIRQLFNDFWTGIDDKPATFAERLDLAEGYINQRLADCDAGWQLDPATRKQLGLPAFRASA